MWLSRRKLMLVWHLREIGNICPNMPIFPWHEGFSEHLLNCANWAELDTTTLTGCPIFLKTVLWLLHTRLWWVLTKTAFISDSINCYIYISPITHSWYKSTSVAHYFLVIQPWPQCPCLWYFAYSKYSKLTSFLNEEFFTPWEMNSLLNLFYKVVLNVLLSSTIGEQLQEL